MVQRREIAARSGLVIASLLVGLLALELGCRLTKGRYWLLHWPNTAVGTVHEQAADQKHWAVHDPLLGYRPKPGRSFHGVFDRDGFRRTPLSGMSSPVIATGGSFTQGDEVADDEAWPAALEHMTGHDVINAGASGYGLDQIVLRSQQLAQTLRPAAVIVAFTADNLWRNEMSRLWGAEKPYFSLDGAGRLDLHNVPVPDRPVSATLLQRLFGWSILVETVLGRLSPDDPSMGWYEEWLTASTRARPRGEGERIGCALMGVLAGIGVPVLVVAQYERWTWEGDAAFQAEQRRQTRLILRCAAEAGLATLDTFDVIDSSVRRQGLAALYAADHHSRLGNAIVARSIRDAMARDGQLHRAVQSTRRP